jgi:osmoprotectant transport system permease protein
VGSKKFTESVILGELLRHLAGAAGYPAYHQRELGGTRLLWNALLAGEIDAYPEYTGTLTQEILARKEIGLKGTLEDALAQRGLRMTHPLGFNNTYALGVKADLARQLYAAPSVSWLTVKRMT